MTRARDFANFGSDAPSAIGTAGQALTVNTGASAYEWGTIATGADDVVFPNFASPNNTYASSGTWSKGSLSDDDYVWIYLLGGGSSGSVDLTNGYYSSGMQGGTALILYGKAKFFNGAAYVVGAGGAAAPQADPTFNIGSASTLTLTSTYGSSIMTTANYHGVNPFVKVLGGSTTQATTGIQGSASQDVSFVFGDPMVGWAGIPTHNGTVGVVSWNGGEYSPTNLAGGSSIFGGANSGAVQSGTITPPGVSYYAGNGGASGMASGTDGVYPGGAGGSAYAYQESGRVSGAGAAGNVRVYHV